MLRAGPFPCVWIEDVCDWRSAAVKGVIRGMMAVCALQPGGVRARCRSRRLDTDWRVYVRGYD